MAQISAAPIDVLSDLTNNNSLFSMAATTTAASYTSTPSMTIADLTRAMDMFRNEDPRSGHVHSRYANVEYANVNSYTGDEYTSINNEVAERYLRKSRVFVGSIERVDHNTRRYMDPPRADLYGRYPPSVRETVNYRESSVFDMSTVAINGDPTLISRGGPVFMLSRPQLDGLIHTMVESLSNKNAQVEHIKMCIDKLRTASSTITDIIASGLDEDTPNTVEEILDQCSLEIQEIVDGLEEV